MRQHLMIGRTFHVYKTVTRDQKGICMSMRQFLVFGVGTGVGTGVLPPPPVPASGGGARGRPTGVLHMHKTAPSGQKGNCVSVPPLLRSRKMEEPRIL